MCQRRPLGSRQRAILLEPSMTLPKPPSLHAGGIQPVTQCAVCSENEREQWQEWPSGLMDKASASGAGDCGFESHLGRSSFLRQGFQNSPSASKQLGDGFLSRCCCTLLQAVAPFPAGRGRRGLWTQAAERTARACKLSFARKRGRSLIRPGGDRAHPKHNAILRPENVGLEAAAADASLNKVHSIGNLESYCAIKY